eukprot:3191767-Pleurochrysis_carterae.AAC.1
MLCSHVLLLCGIVEQFLLVTGHIYVRVRANVLQTSCGRWLHAVHHCKLALVDHSTKMLASDSSGIRYYVSVLRQDHAGNRDPPSLD